MFISFTKDYYQFLKIVARWLNGLTQVKSLAQKYELLLTTYFILFIFVSSQQDCQLILIFDSAHYLHVSFLVS